MDWLDGSSDLCLIVNQIIASRPSGLCATAIDDQQMGKPTTEALHSSRFKFAENATARGRSARSSLYQYPSVTHRRLHLAKRPVWFAQRIADYSNHE